MSLMTTAAFVIVLLVLLLQVFTTIKITLRLLRLPFLTNSYSQMLKYLPLIHVRFILFPFEGRIGEQCEMTFGKTELAKSSAKFIECWWGKCGTAGALPPFMMRSIMLLTKPFQQKKQITNNSYSKWIISIRLNHCFLGSSSKIPLYRYSGLITDVMNMRV